MRGSRRARTAVAKEPTRTSPVGVEPSRATSSRVAAASSSSMRSAAAVSTLPAGVRTAPVGVRSSSRAPLSRSRALTCWDTAEGLMCSRSAAATTPPERCTASRTAMRWGERFMKENYIPY